MADNFETNMNQENDIVQETNMNQENVDEVMDFGALMEEKMANFAGAGKAADSATDERLQEMNKKLPAWSLEPPYNFIR